MSVTIERFKQIFSKHKPADEGQWERDDDLSSLANTVEQGTARLKHIRGEQLYADSPALGSILEESEEMSFALHELEWRWKKMDTFVVKQALKLVGKTVHELDQRYAAEKPNDVDGAEDAVRDVCIRIEPALKTLRGIYDRAKLDLENRKFDKDDLRTGKPDLRPKETGERTNNSKGELEEGWNGITERYEYKHPDEWERLKDRDKLDLDVLFDPKYQTNRRLPMAKVGSGVHVQTESELSVKQLETERQATAVMRGSLTDNMKKREGKAKEDVENNCQLATKMAALLEQNPDLLDTDGLLSRIMGPIVGQGQFGVSNNKWDKEGDKEERARKQEEQNQENRKQAPIVIKSLNDAVARIKDGSASGEDGNKIMQFISCFVDGLTEVTEGKQKAVSQLDKIWPLFARTFEVPEDEKGALLRRVQGYKEIAGGVADTLSGKGTRKDDTRGGHMPTDKDYKIEDEDALIKGDISGSMHSCLLAQEFAGSLMAKEEFKQRGESVLVKDKGQLDARAMDALALTAGGKIGENDIVLHTAYEMINGMRAISGTPKVSQSQATVVMAAMLKGGTFTDGMEAIFPKKDLPWLN